MASDFLLIIWGF